MLPRYNFIVLIFTQGLHELMFLSSYNFFDKWIKNMFVLLEKLQLISPKLRETSMDG